MLSCLKRMPAVIKKELFSLEEYNFDELDNLVPGLKWNSCLALIPSRTAPKI